MKKVLFLFSTISIFLFSCTKPQDVTGPKLIFKFKFDSTQARLNNFGQTVTVLPVGHSAMSPKFHLMSSHYIELAPDSFRLSALVIYCIVLQKLVQATI